MCWTEEGKREEADPKVSTLHKRTFPPSASIHEGHQNPSCILLLNLLSSLLDLIQKLLHC